MFLSNRLTKNVDKQKLKNLLQTGNFDQALSELDSLPKTDWTQTYKLRWLRGMGDEVRAAAFARSVYDELQDNSNTTPRSEKFSQLRHIALIFCDSGQEKLGLQILSDLAHERNDNASIRREYAYALSCDGQLTEAIEQWQDAICLEPKHPGAHSQLAKLHCRLGQSEEAYNAFARAATASEHDAMFIEQMVHWSNHLVSTSQQSNFQLARLWAKKIFENKELDPPKLNNIADRDKTIKLGLVSTGFYAHAASFFIKPLLRNLNPTRFEITAYNESDKNDAVTKQIRSFCSNWRDSHKLSIDALREQIVSDQIDVLIDLSGHNPGSRLAVFAQRIAPIQMTWLGYPSTSGLSTMDYRITDRITDPVGLDDEYYSESLLRLNNGFFCYEPLATAPEVTPSKRENGIRFGSFNNLAKVSATTLDCWASALRKTPDSTLLMKRHQLKYEQVREFFWSELEKRGVDRSRVFLEPATQRIEDHLARYNDIDIALDTSPYNGSATILEALWMGVPVVSLKTQRHAGRISATILHRLGLSNLSVDSIDEFGTVAAKQSSDLEKLDELKSSLRNTMQNSPLLNEKQFGHDFGAALSRQWKLWCDQQLSVDDVAAAS